ncbi:MAG TPA: hypothetical protein PKA51_05755 [Kiritimatiellia bacterium]|nr:hypothetical protein [Kiritimatiellia bacterium]
MPQHAHLPRLAPEFYRGFAMVHWTLSIHDRKTGWLHDPFHSRFREVLLHAAVRYDFLCPVYCLMPDHAHMIWCGVDEASDQRNAIKFFKTHTKPLLTPAAWQRESYDNVLREKDRERNAFQAASYYILANPVRTGLCAQVADWPFSGAMAPGYPDLSPHDPAFWDLFWRIYAARRAADGGRSLTTAATGDET